MLDPLDWSDSDEEFFAANAGDAHEMAGNGDDDADVNLALAAANDANLNILAAAGAAQAAGVAPPLVPPPPQQQPLLAPVPQPLVPGEQPPVGQQQQLPLQPLAGQQQQHVAADVPLVPPGGPPPGGPPPQPQPPPGGPPAGGPQPGAAAPGVAQPGQAVAGPAAAPVFYALTQDQLAQLRGGHARQATLKLEPFDALDPESWRNFRARCDVALRRNGWGQQAAKEMIFGAVTGKAASRISHVRLGSDPEIVPPMPDAKTYENFMTELQNCFHHVEQSALARGAFQVARQKAGETVQEWHSRARILFKEAYPGRDWDTSEDLIIKFNHGLIDELLATFLSDQQAVQAVTYSDCLRIVQGKQGRLAQVKAARRSNYTINAVGDDNGEYRPAGYTLAAGGSSISAINDHRGGLEAPTNRRANAMIRAKGVDGGGDRYSFSRFRNRQHEPRCTECNLDSHRTDDCPRLATMRGRMGRRTSGRGQGQRRGPKRTGGAGRYSASSAGGKGKGRQTRGRPRPRARTARSRTMNAIQSFQDGEEQPPSDDEAVNALSDCLRHVRFHKEN